MIAFHIVYDLQFHLILLRSIRTVEAFSSNALLPKSIIFTAQGLMIKENDENFCWLKKVKQKAEASIKSNLLSS